MSSYLSMCRQITAQSFQFINKTSVLFSCSIIFNLHCHLLVRVAFVYAFAESNKDGQIHRSLSHTRALYCACADTYLLHGDVSCMFYASVKFCVSH